MILARELCRGCREDDSELGRYIVTAKAISRDLDTCRKELCLIKCFLLPLQLMNAPA